MNAEPTDGAVIACGRVVMTAGLQAELEELFEEDLNKIAPLLGRLLRRHAAGDWGDVDQHDKRVNWDAVKSGGRILSSYKLGNIKVWIITDAVTDICPACWAGIGTCEPEKGEWLSGTHFRTDLPVSRLTTTIMRPDDY